MVAIKYCPQCQKAKREHLFKTVICQFCGSEMVSVEASRTRYFYLMLPFLLLGVIFHLYTMYGLILAEEKLDTSFTFGLVLLGIGMYIIAIGFQVLDSKQMEKEALNIGSSRAKRPRGSTFRSGTDTDIEAKTRGPTLRVRGPKGPAKGPPATEGAAEEPLERHKEGTEPEPPKKEIPVRRPKEKGPAKEAAEKEPDAPATISGAKKKKGKPSGSKTAKTGKAPKHSPPKARKILTR